ncbi:MAG: GH92 family glycosyl hydrolase, partial [Bacteroides sp.]
TLPGTQEQPEKGYRSKFDKQTETAVPGFYGVTLADYGIKVELTATERVGYHRYTYPESDTARILFDIGHPQGESAKVVDTQIRYDVATNTVSGFVESYPVYATFCDKDNTVKSYFYARLSKAATGVGTYRDSVVYNRTTEIDGVGTGMYVEFSTQPNEVVEMQVGLSYTSVANARMNLEKETVGRDFDKVRADARDTWNRELSKIEVEGGTDADKTKFYTGLYHALLGRGIASDVDGSYVTNTKQVARIACDGNGVPLYNHHNTDGIWGGFWDLTQVWTLAYPEVFESYVRSTIDFSRHTGGWLHDGEAAGVYTNGVQTNFQGLIAGAAYQAGILKEDTAYLWKVVYQNELGFENRPDGAGRYDNGEFVQRGYVPLKNYVLPNGWVTNFGASHTLEYCFAAYAASQLAVSLGKTAEAAQLRKYAEGYKLLFDRGTGYIRPREESGAFMEEFNPMKAWLGFQEGNAAQYTWYVPHDVFGIMSMIGKEKFNQRLEETFSTASKTLYGGKKGEFDSFSGIEQLYNHGNQPCLHNSWLFNYSGKPWLTQRYTRDICKVFYGTEPTHGYGYGQDEDQGQLGAWYVLASMGLFDVQGGTNSEPTMQIGSPLFDKITIHLNKKYY